MKQAGYADLPLHYGKVPPWLAQRMSSLGKAIIEAVVLEYGKGEVLRRLSDPCWFQSLGCVLGMDWHSSGITTSVIGALKRAINPYFNDLGLYVCGGRGKHSRKTPQELIALSEKTGLDGDSLVRNSRLTAKVDNNTIQDGFQIYLHAFIVCDTGEWTVVQQGMNTQNGMARRYHWHSEHFQSFVETPHSSIYGKRQGYILNLTDKEAHQAKGNMLALVQEPPTRALSEIRKVLMPSHHDVRAKDVNLKRLGSVLALAHERELTDFESLLLLEGVGPRTVQSLALVSEVIYGSPTRFSDPARFSFAHGGKDGHPFPVPLKVYDESIHVLEGAIHKAKLGKRDKLAAFQNLSKVTENIEKDFVPNAKFDEVIAHERATSYQYGGMTVMGKAKAPQQVKNGQLNLF